MNKQTDIQIGQQDIVVLKATANDSKEIWSWRNDELTKKMFMSTNDISWENHSHWYKKSLENPNMDLYLGFLNGETKIGMCRFDIDTSKKIAKVSINLNPKFRNKKLSTKLLLCAINKFYEERNVDLIATIKKINARSITCFTKIGFMFDHEDDEYNHYKLYMIRHLNR